MKSLFTSLSGAITLSFAALLIELFRGFIDSMFVYPFDFRGSELVLAVVSTIIFGIWGAALFAAREGMRWGLIAAFAIGLFLWVTQDWGTILVYCSNGCNSMWSMITAYAGLLVGGLALIALGLQLWRKRVSVTA